jgi:HEPN domain-containing protein
LKSIELARDFMARATSRLNSAKVATGRKEYPDVVRYSQECVEFSLKACLRFVGVEYPREHDVSDVLLEVADSFPKWFRNRVEELAGISRNLAVLRGPSTYGEEERGVPPSKLFGQREASAALADAKTVFGSCSKLLG